MPILSVISGAYNLCDCFSFEKSVESILSQSFTDFEFIICDDGSTDKTYEILLRFAESDGRIKLLRNEKNLGLAATLNKCLSAASGEFIGRHDCDDYSAPDRFQKQIEYLKEHPEISILGTSSFLFDGFGVYDTLIYPRAVTDRDFLFNSPYQHGAVVFRASALREAGGYCAAKLTRRAEDYELFMRMQKYAKGENLPEPLYYFLEDEKARKRRKFRYRIDEARIRYRGFRSLGLLPSGLAYVIKPLIVGLLPRKFLEMLRKRRRQKQREKAE